MSGAHPSTVTTTAGASSSAGSHAPDEAVDGGVARLAMTRTPGPAGGDRATVVLLSGAGDPAASWFPVRRQLADAARVLGYDRAGIGDSAHLATADRPTLERYLAELEGILAGLRAGDTAAERAPLVLVGHSLGGLIAATYAQRHPGTVDGLVLVDATPEQAGHDRAVTAGFAVSGGLARLLRAGSRVGLTQLLLRLRLMPAYPEQRQWERHLSKEERRTWRSAVARSFRHAAAAELCGVPAAARTARDLFGRSEPKDAARFGDLPLAVVSSAAYGRKWSAWQDDLARSSRWSCHLRTGDRSHNIHLRHPDLVVHAVRQVVAEMHWRNAPASGVPEDR